MDTNIYRKHIRLPKYDYRHGYFFVTVVIAGRRKILTGEDDSALRNIIEGVSERFPGWSVDIQELMPDHAHLILIASHARSALGRVVASIKAMFTRNRRGRGHDEGEVWQRNYYERVIRDEEELNNVRLYIAANPGIRQIDWEAMPWNRKKT